MRKKVTVGVGLTEREEVHFYPGSDGIQPRVEFEEIMAELRESWETDGARLTRANELLEVLGSRLVIAARR